MYERRHNNIYFKVSGDERNKSVPLSQQLRGQRLVYTTPEFLQMNAEMRDWVRMAERDKRLARIVLDEAHCVLEWGNTFRPSYLQLCQWKTQYFSELPVTLATASISDEDIARLAALLNLKLLPAVPTDEAIGNKMTKVQGRHGQLVLVQQVTDRKNLRMEVVRKTAQAAKWISNRVGKETTIVYCMTRKEAEDTCLELVRTGCRAGVYHGGIPQSPDSDGMGVGAISNGSSRVELEEVAAFCEMTAGCRKGLLYSHFGFAFDMSRCVRNCNCSDPLDAGTESWSDEEHDYRKLTDKIKMEEEDCIPRGTIEYQYQKVLAESKRLKLPNREALSRRLIRVQPASC
ncbi:unnamed protein product [Phytophthora lilii]|uniref:Unnamed protein product n=1 Tax=Phytophthora lilii TaxID=2077276 RepID=A0A9W6YIX2_9STRA|nr:unnamed protein product [Phytophthora lilii]